MKLEVRFSAKELNFNRRFQVVSIIKDIFRDEGIYSKFYQYKKDNGILVTNKDQKPFGFAIIPYDLRLRKLGNFSSVKQKSYTIASGEHGKVILNSGVFSIIFSSHDYDILKIIANGIDKHSEYIKQQYGWELIESPAEPYNEPEVLNHSVTLKLISPLYVKDKEGESISLIKDPLKFNREFNYIMNIVSKKLRGYEIETPFIVEPLRGTKEYKTFLYSDETGKKYFGIAVYGKILLIGTSEDINFAIDACIGFRRSQGFGLVYPTYPNNIKKRK